MSKYSISLVMVFLMTVISFSITYMRWHSEVSMPEIAILSGSRGGDYYRLANELTTPLSSLFKVKVVETSGTFDNIERLTAGNGNLAFYQNNGTPGEDIFVLAPLYRETVFILAREGIESLWQIPQGAKVSVGAKGSGTRLRAREILAQYRLTDRVTNETSISYAELKAAFMQKRVDLAFLVLGMHNALVKELLTLPGVHLLPLDLREGLCRNTAANLLDVVPANSFAPGIPEKDIPTISNIATLVVKQSFPSDTAERILQILDRQKLLNLSLLQKGKQLDFPLHPSLIDLTTKRWPSSTLWNRIQRIKGWLFTSLILTFLLTMLIVFRQSLKESVDEFLFVNGYRARLREIQEQFEADENLQQVLEDAQLLADTILNDVQTGMVDKTVQVAFIHHELMQLIAKLLKRQAIDLPSLRN